MLKCKLLTLSVNVVFVLL